ncbi:hypothetical protein [Allosediminivita pacifica]|uniref:Uncharacterized protein n=1 Tax=Allosediminivita pacifica TaxID=1267769 RepID=A0A2T6B7D5_9RHOB|nr:hypothetical protein [Allosediminivita pacifica]PTX51963.1 hypothetical protein C8N44_1027 [Allosediminivita pacifica]GGA98300.1 hypothetical protein GCM10011324_05700 [Allosediminivita pacifica]
MSRLLALQKLVLCVPATCQSVVKRGRSDKGIGRQVGDAAFLETVIRRAKRFSRAEINRLLPSGDGKENETTPAQIEDVKMVASLATTWSLK